MSNRLQASASRSRRIARSLLIGISQLLAALAVIPIGFIHDLTVAIACITTAVAFIMRLLCSQR